MNANFSFSFFLLISLTLPIFSQQLVCKKNALSAVQRIPKLQYRCPKNFDNDYDEKILKLPQRISALASYQRSLEMLTFGNWWNTSVEDLNVCDFRHKIGILSKDEKHQFKNGGYIPDLFGQGNIRVLRVSDPCYQTDFGGSNIFLLNQKNGKIFASEIIDGFFSRADMIFADFAMNGSEQIIEIATSSGGLHPTVTNYYFTIDKKTNRAVPKNLFIGDGNKPDNEISSEMLLYEPEEYGLPPKSEALQIIKNGRLAKRFDIFINTYETFGEEKREKFSKLTLRWNGKIYK